MALTFGEAASLLSMWVVYDHPTDMPAHIVARRHEIYQSGSEPTTQVLIGATLQAVRDQLPRGLTRLPPDPADDPKIVEVWV
jgi:hypothetical protein